MIKKSVFHTIILLLLLFIPSVFADKVIFDKKLSNHDIATIDGVDYDVLINDEERMIVMDSMFITLLIAEGTCEYENNMDYCFDEYIKKDADRYSTVKVKVTLNKDQTYTKDNITYTKLTIGKECDKDKDCVTGVCVHNVCSYRTIICGDGYCEDKESCESDCGNGIQKVSDDPFSFSFPLNREWINTEFLMKADKNYSFDIFNPNLLKNNKEIGIDKQSNNSQCPEFLTSEVVGSACGQCFKIVEKANFSFQEDCELFVMVNDYILYDNSGRLNLTIIDYEYVSNNSKNKSIIQNNSVGSNQSQSINITIESPNRTINDSTSLTSNNTNNATNIESNQTSLISEEKAEPKNVDKTKKSDKNKKKKAKNDEKEIIEAEIEKENSVKWKLVLITVGIIVMMIVLYTLIRIGKNFIVKRKAEKEIEVQNQRIKEQEEKIIQEKKNRFVRDSADLEETEKTETENIEPEKTKNKKKKSKKKK